MPGQVLSGYTIPSGGPAGLDVANDGTLIVLDEFNATVYSVSCNAQSASCNGLGHWRLRASGFYGKLDRANAQYQVANQQTGQVDVYAYPGFTYQYSYDNGLGYYDNVVGITEFPE
jgi:hypothetical protein